MKCNNYGNANIVNITRNS